jgi:hypothetical protein
MVCNGCGGQGRVFVDFNDEPGFSDCAACEGHGVLVACTAHAAEDCVGHDVDSPCANCDLAMRQHEAAMSTAEELAAGQFGAVGF